MNELEITGRTRTHVYQFDAPRFAAVPDVGRAFLAMRSAAAEAGFDLLPFSTFRDFNTQLRIWNDKFSGRKTLYDINGRARDFSALLSHEVIDCILNWSALPGGSRHHWGTEIDVVDGASMAPGYRPKLLPEEVMPGGIFHPLHCWLDDNIARFGFFRPYKSFQGGMYPEPWHLSYAPISAKAIELVTPDLLRQVIKEADVSGKEQVLERIDDIYMRHILNVGPADSVSLSAAHWL